MLIHQYQVKGNLNVLLYAYAFDPVKFDILSQEWGRVIKNLCAYMHKSWIQIIVWRRPEGEGQEQSGGVNGRTQVGVYL